MGWESPGAFRVRISLLYWPDCEGAWTVNVSTVVPGAMLPTAIVLPEMETWVAGPPFTDSVQPRKVNFVRSPDETMVALLKVVLPWLYR